MNCYQMVTKPMSKKLSIYSYLDYKVYILDIFQNSKNNGRGMLGKLAKFLDVHSSYVSQVINGQKEFSAEQAILVSSFLNLFNRDKDYFLELIYYARSGNPELKKHHLESLAKIQAEALQVKSRVGKAKELSEEQKIIYYSDWVFMAVWLSTSIKEMNDNKSIATLLNQSSEKVAKALEFLIEAGLCEYEKNELKMKVKKTHLTSDSLMIKNHHLNWRLKSIDASKSLPNSELMFTAPISVSHTDFAKIKELILTLIEEISLIVKESEPEVIACLNFDHFTIGSN